MKNKVHGGMSLSELKCFKPEMFRTVIISLICGQVKIYFQKSGLFYTKLNLRNLSWIILMMQLLKSSENS